MSISCLIAQILQQSELSEARNSFPGLPQEWQEPKYLSQAHRSGTWHPTRWLNCCAKHPGDQQVGIGFLSPWELSLRVAQVGLFHEGTQCGLRKEAIRGKEGQPGLPQPPRPRTPAHTCSHLLQNLAKTPVLLLSVLYTQTLQPASGLANVNLCFRSLGRSTPSRVLPGVFGVDENLFQAPLTAYTLELSYTSTLSDCLPPSCRSIRVKHCIALITLMQIVPSTQNC